jgi:hypothetical protein
MLNRSCAESTLDQSCIDASLGPELTVNTIRCFKVSIRCEVLGEQDLEWGWYRQETKEENDSEHNQWHLGNIIEVWSCRNLENLGS